MKVDIIAVYQSSGHVAIQKKLAKLGYYPEWIEDMQRFSYTLDYPLRESGFVSAMFVLQSMLNSIAGVAPYTRVTVASEYDGIDIRLQYSNQEEDTDDE